MALEGAKGGNHEYDHSRSADFELGFIFAWAMQRYSAKSAAARLQKPEYTAEQIAAAVALSGNPSGF